MEGYHFDHRPFLVFWEITRACALACSHCRAEAQPKRHPEELDSAKSLKLISQLAEWKPPMLILTGGDPLMRRDALDLVRAATDSGLHVGLSPSATERLLHTDFAEIKVAGVKCMSLSPDGAPAKGMAHSAASCSSPTSARFLPAAPAPVPMASVAIPLPPIPPASINRNQASNF